MKRDNKQINRQVLKKINGQSKEAPTQPMSRTDRGLLVEEFVPPDAVEETVGLLTPWPVPLYHDTPSLPAMRIGPLCTVQVCGPHGEPVAEWAACQCALSPDRRMCSVSYAPRGCLEA